MATAVCNKMRLSLCLFLSCGLTWWPPVATQINIMIPVPTTSRHRQIVTKAWLNWNHAEKRHNTALKLHGMIFLLAVAFFKGSSCFTLWELQTCHPPTNKWSILVNYILSISYCWFIEKKNFVYNNVNFILKFVQQWVGEW